MCPPTGYATPSLTWVERHFGYGTARAYAGHTDSTGPATTTYIKADLHAVAAALSAMTGQQHPLAESHAPVEGLSRSPPAHSPLWLRLIGTEHLVDVAHCEMRFSGLFLVDFGLALRERTIYSYRWAG